MVGKAIFKNAKKDTIQTQELCAADESMMMKSIAIQSDVFRVSPDDFNFELPEPDQYY
jgi:hypothetical protein